MRRLHTFSRVCLVLAVGLAGACGLTYHVGAAVKSRWTDPANQNTFCLRSIGLCSGRLVYLDTRLTSPGWGEAQLPYDRPSSQFHGCRLGRIELGSGSPATNWDWLGFRSESFRESHGELEYQSRVRTVPAWPLVIFLAAPWIWAWLKSRTSQMLPHSSAGTNAAR